MKIYRQNPFTPVAATRKLRKFTDETNMQARNHENSDEICAQPVRHLDLATPAFYYYRKNPKCYHTVWGKKLKWPWHNQSNLCYILDTTMLSPSLFPSLLILAGCDQGIETSRKRQSDKDWENHSRFQTKKLRQMTYRIWSHTWHVWHIWHACSNSHLLEEVNCLLPRARFFTGTQGLERRRSKLLYIVIYSKLHSLLFHINSPYFGLSWIIPWYLCHKVHQISRWLFVFNLQLRDCIVRDHINTCSKQLEQRQGRTQLARISTGAYHCIERDQIGFQAAVGHFWEKAQGKLPLLALVTSTGTWTKANEVSSQSPDWHCIQKPKSMLPLESFLTCTCHCTEAEFVKSHELQRCLPFMDPRALVDHHVWWDHKRFSLMSFLFSFLKHMETSLPCNA